MSARRTRTVTVINKLQLTPNMLRIILGGNDLHDFPEEQESAYVKLLLPRDQGVAKRSYTIRAFNPDALELTLDFVVHGKVRGTGCQKFSTEDHQNNGPALIWALNVSPGDSVQIDGPGPVKRVNHTANWFLLAGDMTALPAISVNLERLPARARGYAVIEIIEEQDRQIINTADTMAIHWVVNSKPGKPNSVLVDTVKALPWLGGTPGIWVASEFDAMRRLRRYFKEERQVNREWVYASSYWKMGETDEGNKAAKKIDSEAEL